MNSIDLINKIAQDNALTPGRAEMIFNIIIEQIVENIKTGNPVSIPRFGSFQVVTRDSGAALYGYESIMSRRCHINFTPDTNFLNLINS